MTIAGRICAISMRADDDHRDPEPVPGQRVRGGHRDGQRQQGGEDADDQRADDVAALGIGRPCCSWRRRRGRQEVVVRAQQLAVVLQGPDDHRVQREQQDDQGDERAERGQHGGQRTLPGHVMPSAGSLG